MTNTFSNTLGDVGGQRANGGGFGGFGDVVTYQWTNNNGGFTTLWTATYDNVNDYQYVIRETTSDPKQAYATSIARIMKSMAFARLVDQFNDVPYSEALQGNKILTPKFDKAEDVYQDLVKQLDTAMITIAAAKAKPDGVNSIKSSADPLFKGDMTKMDAICEYFKATVIDQNGECSCFTISIYEAFNEFRLTGFPAIVDGSIDATRSFASKQSTSTRADKLPSRLLYPQNEFNLNPTNVPTGINQFTSRIFWDLN